MAGRETRRWTKGNTRKVYWYRCNVSTQVRGPWPGRSRFTAFDGARRKRDERRCDHGCKDLSRTYLSSLSRLMSLFRNVHVRFPGGCTGCNECPVPRLDRSTPSEWGCNRDPKTPIPKNTSSVSTYSGGKQGILFWKIWFLRIKSSCICRAW